MDYIYMNYMYYNVCVCVCVCVCVSVYFFFDQLLGNKFNEHHVTESRIYKFLIVVHWESEVPLICIDAYIDT
jgi:hypothetical protein